MSLSQEFLSSKYDVLCKEVEKLNEINKKKQREDKAVLDVNSADLEKRSNLDSLKIDSIEQYERRKNLESVVVPETNKEDTADVVMELCRALGVNVEKKDVSTAHRLAAK